MNGLVARYTWCAVSSGTLYPPTFGVCPRTLPARARDPCALPNKYKGINVK